MATTKEGNAIAALLNLAETWPDTIQLFSDSGSLLVVRVDTHEVLAHIPGIINDGGDAGTYYRDDSEYLGIDNGTVANGNH